MARTTAERAATAPVSSRLPRRTARRARPGRGPEGGPPPQGGAPLGPGRARGPAGGEPCVGQPPCSPAYSRKKSGQVVPQLIQSSLVADHVVRPARLRLLLELPPRSGLHS